MSLEKVVAGIFIGILVLTIISLGVGASFFSVLDDMEESENDDGSGEKSN